MKDYQKFHKESWKELKRLSDEDNPLEFFNLYCEYLEKSNIISWEREALYKMCLRAKEVLNEGA